MTQKGLAPILIVLILAALVGGYLVYKNQSKPTPPQQTIQPTSIPSSKPNSSPITDIFQNNSYTKRQIDTSGAILELLYPKAEYPTSKGWNMNYPNEINLDDTQLVGMKCTKYIKDSSHGISSINVDLLKSLNLNTKNLPSYKNVKANDIFSFLYCETEDKRVLFFYTSDSTPSSEKVHIAITQNANNQDNLLNEITSSSTLMESIFSTTMPIELTKDGKLYVQQDGGDSAYSSSIFRFNTNNPADSKQIINCFSTPIDAGHCKIL